MKEGILRFVNRGKLYIEEQLDAANEMAEIVAEVSKISKVDAFKIGLILFMASAPAMASSGSDQDPWGSFYKLTKSWMTGNLGKFVALLTFIIGLVMSIFTHSAKPIVYALILAVIIGGAIGLVGLFFNAGSKSFGQSFGGSSSG